ncbi:Phytochrome-like protein cph2 [Aquicella siphonis]|uniref:cyclic-guanylate-specific phosphodiesterase n=1 Tax=Aquicella siphonis TaxID=254247 RepID=A0A5E4PL97_9COXI|nr:EAL domain-containing protein [Aquicella siphonis]VVC77191.1 Phytochrome-like protein cph2 [Aquicella siphonis]
MKLNNKVLLGIALVWLMFLIAAYAGSRLYMLDSYLVLEQEKANRDLARIDQSLDQLHNSLRTFTFDWSHWGEVYAFMQGKNAAFVRNNFNLATFIASDIDFLTYWDKHGKLLAGAAIDSRNERFIPYPAGLEEYLYPGSFLLDNDTKNTLLSSYISLPEGIMMLAVNDVTDGKITTTPIGKLIAGRFLSDKMMQTMRKMTQLDLELLPVDTNAGYADPVMLKNAIAGLADNHFIKITDDKTLQGYVILRDFNGRPLALIRMTAPRGIYMSGQKTTYYFLAIFVAFGILASLILMIFIRLLVIRRLENLDRGVADISANNRFDKRVWASGNDELSSVARQINKMMGVIQASQEALECRVLERTQELQLANEKLRAEIHERLSMENELLVHREHLARLAHYDSLTSLPNRIYFNQLLDHEISIAAQENGKFAVLFIDLDRFKNINDAFGHQVGDRVLNEVAKRMKAVLKEDDLLARLGGDEFIILLRAVTGRKMTDTCAENIIKVFSQPITVENHEFYLSASMGISIFPDDGDSLEILQRNADLAMYECKYAGGHGYSYFTRDMTSLANEKVQMEYAIRKALENKEFILYYQPKYHVSSGAMAGVEALIRWNHPELGVISPSRFIPLAEETGLVLQIGEWVLHEACRACRSWQMLGFEPVRVAVNLSARQFHQHDFAERVMRALDEAKLDAKYLELEITESAIMENIDGTAARLLEIQNMNVAISIDDFGTGYTSIGYLNKLPVSILKIDKEFIHGIPFNHSDNAIAAAVIALAHNLGLKVVAEGVESSEQLQWLSDHGCDMAQGYFLSKPLPEQQLIKEFANSGAAAGEASGIVLTA